MLLYFEIQSTFEVLSKDQCSAMQTVGEYILRDLWPVLIMARCHH